MEHLGDFTVTWRTALIAGYGLVVGGISACVAWLLLNGIGLVTNLVFYQRVDTRLVAPGLTHHNPLLVLAAPVLGGLIVGAMARYGSEKIRGHGMPEAIESILIGGSKVRPRVAVLKPISAIITIGTGGPFGAEGPIIMTGGAFGSIGAQFLKLSADERKTLLVAGAAAGMAATFNAPLASVLLAVEMLLFEWRPRSFVPVAGAVVTATVVRAYIISSGPIFPVPPAPDHFPVSVYGGAVLIGLLGGGLAMLATGLVYFAEDSFKRLPIHWMWWPAIGGLVIGIGGLVEPRALGVGYDVIHQLLDGSATMGLIIGILVVKTLIWSLSLGSGTSGGVLAPVFMIGGSLGALVGQWLPAVTPGFWALVALAAVVGGVMRSPFTGVVFALELTHDWGTLLPLLVSATLAFGLSAVVLKRSVLTEKIARHGYHLTREYDVDPLEVLFIHEVLQTESVSFTAGTPAGEVAATFVAEHRQLRDRQHRQHRQRMYPIVDAQDRLVGIVTRRDMLDVALSGERADEPIERLAVVDPAVCHPDDTLRQVAYRMADLGVSRMPVVDRDDPQRLVGIVTLVDLLAGRLRDLREARVFERVLRVREFFPTGPIRSRTHDEVVPGEED
ncbi:MAG TPA: chloride channel protein [Nocardioidaceae bacterium]|nr:chloride channel protein [Nocardioidaceae bacterium]